MSIKAIYIYASESSHYVLSEYGIVHYTMTYCFGDISVWSRGIEVESASFLII